MNCSQINMIRGFGNYLLKELNICWSSLAFYHPRKVTTKLFFTINTIFCRVKGVASNEGFESMCRETMGLTIARKASFEM